jgi:hypothetical protein
VRNWRLVGAAAVILTAAFGGTALADTIIGTTTQGVLGNGNPSTVEGWLETLLGGQDVRLVKDYSASGDPKSLTLNPNVSWDYAVVKFGQYFNAYSDSPNDNIIVVQGLSNGVSNIRFFAVPEPSALLLLGAGLVAAAPFVRSRRRRA